MKSDRPAAGDYPSTTRSAELLFGPGGAWSYVKTFGTPVDVSMPGIYRSTWLPALAKFLKTADGQEGVLPTVVSSGAIWTEIEPGFHIELEAPGRIDVLPD